MLEIVLTRHGKPTFPRAARGRLVTFPEWIGLNMSSTLRAGTVPDAAVQMILQRVAIVATSDTPRAVESARRLRLGATTVVSPLFREAELSHRIGRGARMPGVVWEFLVRGLWRLGVTPELASRRAAVDRAREAAAILEDLAARHGSVALVGHGVMNRLIARRLRRQGWSGPDRTGRSYWESVRYRKAGPGVTPTGVR